jgi:hypothetical protein
MGALQARDLTGTDTIENLARLAGTMLLAASFKLGRGSWLRARSRPARDSVARPRRSGRNARLISRSGADSARRRARVRTFIGVLWISLLLAIVGYAALAGEAGFAQLDEIGIPVVTE